MAQPATQRLTSEQYYEVAGKFSGGDLLTSSLFPGLENPLSRLFRLAAD